MIFGVGVLKSEHTLRKPETVEGPSIDGAKTTITRVKRIQPDGALEPDVAVESGEPTVGTAHESTEISHEERPALVEFGMMDFLLGCRRPVLG